MLRGVKGRLPSTERQILPDRLADACVIACTNKYVKYFLKEN
jgi:hypothetical protein